MFGINIPARKPYVFGLIGGAAGGLVAALFGAKGYSFGAGLIGIGSLLGPEGVDMSFYGGLLGMLVAFVISFAMTWFFGWSKDSEDALKM
jgi:PTS system beta-glucosides-specific IIC component